MARLRYFFRRTGSRIGPAALEGGDVTAFGFQAIGFGDEEGLVFILGIGGIGQHGFRCFEANAFHGFAEQFTVFRHIDGFSFGANELDAEFFEDAHLVEGEGGVQRGLPAHGGEQGVGPFLLDDLGHDFRGDGFDVGGVGQVPDRS